MDFSRHFLANFQTLPQMFSVVTRYVTRHASGTRASNQPIRQMLQLTNHRLSVFFSRTNQNLAGKHFEGGQRSLKAQIVHNATKRVFSVMMRIKL